MFTQYYDSNQLKLKLSQLTCELKPKRKFYDYQAKYNLKAKTKHIIPVELSKKKTNLNNVIYKLCIFTLQQNMNT